MAKLAVAGFDYTDAHRGHWARLRDGGGRDVILTEFPGTLLAMLRAGVLAGQAKFDAEEINHGLGLADHADRGPDARDQPAGDLRA